MFFGKWAQRARQNSRDAMTSGVDHYFTANLVSGVSQISE